MEWRPVVGYEGIYEVSDGGEIRWVEKTVEKFTRYGRSLGFVTIPPKVITKVVSRGYYRVRLLISPKNAKWWMVHRLVGFAFVPGYFEGAIINHIDGNKQNNTPPNLEWTTLIKNVHHAYNTGLVRDRNGGIASIKFTEEDIKLIRRIEGKSSKLVKEMSKKYNCTRSHIGAIRRYKVWKHVKD